MGKENKRIRIILGGVVGILLVVLLLLSVNIKQVSVSGNHKYTEEEIVELFFSEKGDRNSLLCFLKNKIAPKERIPFIEDYKIVFQSPTKVEVIIYEKSVVGYVSYMNSNMYFDKDGIIVESSNKKLEGIPWVGGLEFGHIVLYQPLSIKNERIFDEILNLTQVLSNYGILVDKISYDNEGSARLMIDEVEVVLGSNYEINGKITELNDMLPSLSGLSGTLYLDTYDPVKTGSSYRFIKKKW